MPAPNTITPMDFELRDRQEEVDKLTRTIIKQFISCQTRPVYKKYWYLIAITGGSGTGKTRLSISALNLAIKLFEKEKNMIINYIQAEMKRRSNNVDKSLLFYNMMLESLKKHKTIYVDFTNGDYFLGWKESPKESFLLTLVSKLYFTSTKVGKIYDKIKDFNTLFTVENTAKAIRENFKMPPGKPISIAVNIDEIQEKITTEDLETLLDSKKDKNSIFIRRIGLAVMDVVQELAEHKIYVIPIFSGTLSLHYAGIFPATNYSILQITPSPLQNESSKYLIKKAIKDNISLPLILSMGNIPRALEFLVTAYNERKRSDRDLFEAVVAMIIDNYKIAKGSISLIGYQGLKRLIQYCLSGKRVQRTDALEGVDFGTLEREGILFLKSSPMNENENPVIYHQIIIPLVFATAFARRFNVLDPKFVTFRPIVTFSELEKFSRDFDVFQNNFLVELGKTEMTLGERYYGSLMSPKLASTPIKLSYMTSYHSKYEQLPKNGSKIEVMDNPSSPIVDLARECASVWFGRQCTTNDIATSSPNQANNKTIIRLEEWKSTIVFQEAKSAGVEKGDIRKERENALTGKVLSDNFPQDKFQVYFAFMSNAYLGTKVETLQKEILNNDDTMIVTKDQFPQRFSPIFACLAEGDIRDDEALK